MKTEELLQRFKNSMIRKESDEENNEWVIFGLPFFHLGHPDSIAIKLTYKNGELIVSDCHTTTDYLYADNVDLEDHSDKLTKIMQKFDIFQDGEVFRKVIHNHDNSYREIGYFIEAISLITYINL